MKPRGAAWRGREDRVGFAVAGVESAGVRQSDRATPPADRLKDISGRRRNIATTRISYRYQ
jgi:hypothetical protein